MRSLSFLVLALATPLAACTGSGGDTISISGLEVTNEDDGLSALDVEIHVFDADANQWLGCAGQDTGLEAVDASDVLYDTDAYLADADGFRLGVSDLSGRELYFEVIEDDIDPCPAPPDVANGDDVIGTSGPLPADALDGSYAFENVVELDLSVY